MVESKTQTLPTHIGIILDGNRRWAKQRGLPVFKGHEQGYQTLVRIIDQALKRNIKYVSVFAFSTENWHRAKDEVGFLMDLSLQKAVEDLKKQHEKGIRLVWLGTENRVSQKLVKAIRDAEAVTAKNTRLVLGLCFNYGGQLEIVDAVKKLVKDGVQADEITEETIASRLYGPEIPPIDLLVRTSGEQRLSNFMLWRAAYSEIIFTDKLWPDFNEADFDAVLDEFTNRNRRFGG